MPKGTPNPTGRTEAHASVHSFAKSGLLQRRYDEESPELVTQVPPWMLP
jgi:hypothetical protein